MVINQHFNISDEFKNVVKEAHGWFLIVLYFSVSVHCCVYISSFVYLLLLGWSLSHKF